MRTSFEAPHLARAVADVTGAPVTQIESIVGGGYSPAKRLIVTFAGGPTVFVKWATEPLTAGWIAKEQHVYQNFGNVNFAPRYMGGSNALDANGDEQPFVVLEDLSGCHWPPPWSPAQVQAVRDALDRVHQTRGAWVEQLPLASDTLGGDKNWGAVATDPTRFLSLGLCSAEWLETSLPTLTQAAQAADFTGEDLLHFDIRSDNVCFRPDGRVCIVDWNWAARGSGAIDVAGWLPSLGHETGILPETVLPGVPEYAAWLAGYFASHASLPPPPLAPRVRVVQLQQLKTALPWATRALGLPLPSVTP